MSNSPLAGRRALVLGASGFIGRWVARELVARGAHTLAQVRDPSRMPAVESLALVSADLLAEGSARELVRREDPDVVFNLAGYGVAKDERDQERARRLNAVMVNELAFALGRSAFVGEPRGGWSGPRLIQVGTALEYGRGSNLDELALPQPNEIYGITKSAATAALGHLRPRVPSLVARPFTVFGPGERPGRLVPTLLAARAGEQRIPLSTGDQQRDFVYVEDVARALVELAEQDGETVRARRYPFDAPCLNLASGALTSVRDFVLAFADEFGLARERLGFGDLPPLPEEMHHPPVPIGRLRAALGWTPPADPHSGLKRMAERLRQGLA